MSFLGPAPGGVDAQRAWTVPGGTGAGARVVVVEAGFGAGAEQGAGSGACSPDEEDIEHGLQSAGIVAAVAPGARVLAMAFGYGGERARDIATAILRASRWIAPEDVLLLEVQARPDPHGPLLPIEVHQEVRAAIRAVPCAVVEAAGNGAVDLDPYLGTDSGAILVGAAYSPIYGPGPPRLGRSLSNHGRRVDCFAWGDSIPRPRPDGRVTRDGGGTSGAAAIVAGVVACLQGAVKAAGRPPLAPRGVRELLRTGTPSASPEDDRIGTMPDLDRMLQRVM